MFNVYGGSTIMIKYDPTMTRHYLKILCLGLRVQADLIPTDLPLHTHLKKKKYPPGKKKILPAEVGIVFPQPESFLESFDNYD